MGNMLIRDVSDAMRRDIAVRAEKNGHSLSDEMKMLLQKAILDDNSENRAARSGWDALREVFSPLTAEERDDFVTIMEEIEAERKQDFGQPIEGFE